MYIAYPSVLPRRISKLLVVQMKIFTNSCLPAFPTSTTSTTSYHNHPPLPSPDTPNEKKNRGTPKHVRAPAAYVLTASRITPSAAPSTARSLSAP